MSPVSLVKAVLSVVGAILLAAAALFRNRRHSVPPKLEPQPEGESPVSSSGKGAPKGVLALLGSGGIVAVVALVGTLASVIVGHVGLQYQLAADQSIRATEQAEERSQREDEQAEERSQRETERVDNLYNHAVNMLASGTPVLQVVGVYELGGVIQAPARNDYDEPVREILAGNLRVFAPSTSGVAASPVPPPLSSRPIIRAIVDVLGKQDPSIACATNVPATPPPASTAEDDAKPLSANFAGVNFREQHLVKANFNEADLRAADFTRADLSSATLCRADLTGADLSDARFSFANLIGADLTSANLADADLIAADLRDAVLSGAVLVFADLTDVDLSGADLSDAVLNFAVLTDAVLTAAVLRGANLIGANLSFAVLTDADFSGADLSNAVLTGADLSNAEFPCADLREADFGGTSVVGVRFDGANLADVDLSATNLTQDQLNTALINDATKLPEGLDRSTAKVTPEGWSRRWDCMRR